jgi:predicted RNase H-like HicB family nuclease
MTISGSEPSASPLTTDSAQFEVVLVTDDSVDYRYAAMCPALPGCVSDGRTRDEALGMIKEAVELYLKDLGSHQNLPEQPLSTDTLIGEYVAAGFPVEMVKIQVRR